MDQEIYIEIICDKLTCLSLIHISYHIKFSN